MSQCNTLHCWSTMPRLRGWVLFWNNLWSFYDPGQILKIRDCPRDSRTVGVYASWLLYFQFKIFLTCVYIYRYLCIYVCTDYVYTYTHACNHACYLLTNLPYSGIFREWKPSRISRFRAIRESFNREIFHWVRWRYYQWACHCSSPQFAKVLIAIIGLTAIRESFHKRKIPAMRY